MPHWHTAAVRRQKKKKKNGENGKKKRGTSEERESKKVYATKYEEKVFFARDKRIVQELSHISNFFEKTQQRTKELLSNR